MKISKKKIAALLILSAILLAVLAFFIYTGDYYHADEDAIYAFVSMPSGTVRSHSGNILVCSPENSDTGFIFYPGGKVEYTAYEPLMQACASRGITCVLLRMPFNLAVFDINSADGIQAMYPDIENWYIGGHSLGGSMAASYVSKHSDEFNGLILLASYSTADISDSGLDVLSVYGSEDRVLSAEKYAANKTNLPADHSEIIIDGGCHAYFGMYGQQDGDGTPSISNEEQINLTADAIAEFIAAD